MTLGWAYTVWKTSSDDRQALDVLNRPAGDKSLIEELKQPSQRLGKVVQQTRKCNHCLRTYICIVEILSPHS
uniref:Uncharacterized protein n=1 Tax=Arion vulgaris TaxID=1028688 RepID=A0A0B6ZRR6_9EUPU